MDKDHKTKKPGIGKWLLIGASVLFVFVYVSSQYSDYVAQRKAASTSRSNQVTALPPAKINHVQAAWISEFDGFNLESRIDVENRSNRKMKFSLSLLVIDDSGKIRKDLPKWTADIPPGMTHSVTIAYPFGFGWPPKGWSYQLYIQPLGSSDDRLATSGTIIAKY